MSPVSRRPLSLVALLAALVLLLVLTLPGPTSGTPLPRFTVESATGSAPNGDLDQVIASCDEDYHVTGGGYEFQSINPALFVHQEIPIDPVSNDGRWGWAVTVLNETGIDVTWTVIALCAKD
jgi:hypothetical protein